MEKKFSRMTYIQRQEIEKLLKEGRSTKGIAKKIGVHRSTVYREVERCEGTYSADEAQRKLTGE